MTTRTKETVTFNHFYQHDYGFNWGIQVLYASYLYQLGYCDTGYNNVLHGNAEAFTSPFSDGYGYFESKDLSETFSMRSMIAAAAWNGEEGFTFNSYQYKNGKLTLKASDYINTYQTSSKIDFANYGKDFKHIVAVAILTGNAFNGHPGSTCTYGSATYGYQMALDNLKVIWDGPIPGHSAGRKFVSPNFAHHAIAALAPLHHGSVNGDHQSGVHAIGPPGRAHGFYHSELLSLHDAHSGLTSQFALPGVEHFGT